MKHIFYSLSVFLMIVISGFCLYGASVQGATEGEIGGYAWSSNIGWISFTGSNYGVSIDQSGGFLSGYAWSPNVGWISFNQSDLIGCPQGQCRAKLDGNSFSGWAKVLSMGENGWISLSGSNYGLTLAGDAIYGYMWGDMVLGWIYSYNLTTGALPTTCFDLIDNDNDGFADHFDNDCPGPEYEETDYDEQCRNNQDDDGDGIIDYGYDDGCTSSTDNTEGSSVVAPTVNLKVGITNPTFDALNLGKEGGAIVLGLTLSNTNETTVCEGSILQKNNSQDFSVTPTEQVIPLTITGESARIVVSCSTTGELGEIVSGTDSVQVILKQENEF